MTKNIKIPTRIELINEHKKKRGQVAAVFPIHYPRPLFLAHNILPLEVWGPPGINPNASDAHLQSYTCSIVRNGLSYILTGGLTMADMIMVPHCCDTLQGLGSILMDFVPMEIPVLTLYIPRGKRLFDVDFFENELLSLNDSLIKISGINPDFETLEIIIETEKRVNKQIKKMFWLRKKLPLSNHEFYKIIRSREYLPQEKFLDITKRVLGNILDHESDHIPVLISGVVPEPMELFDVLTDKKLIVAADDYLNIGRRLYETPEDDNQWKKLAKMILNGPPDSTLGCPVEERLSHILGLANLCKIKGVIFHQIKFCEPEQFYLPLLKKGLGKAGIPSLVIESDIGDPISNQVVTRLEAFSEILA